MLIAVSDADGPGVVFAVADLDVAGIGFGGDGVMAEAVGWGGRDIAVVCCQRRSSEGSALDVDIAVCGRGLEGGPDTGVEIDIAVLAVEGQALYGQGLAGLDGDVAVIRGQGEGFEFGAGLRNGENQLGIGFGGALGLRFFRAQHPVFDREGGAGALWPAVDHGEVSAALKGDVPIG